MLLGSQDEARDEPADGMAITAENRSTRKKKCRWPCSGPTPRRRSTNRAPTPARPPKPAAPLKRARLRRRLAMSAPLPPGSAARACRPSRRPWRCTWRTSPGAAAGRQPSPASSRRSPCTTARWISDPDRPRRGAGRRARHPPATGRSQPQKTALEIDALRSVVLAIPEDLRGLRDRALLLIGWVALCVHGLCLLRTRCGHVGEGSLSRVLAARAENISADAHLTRGHERIRIAEHVKRLGPSRGGTGIVVSRRFSCVPSIGRPVFLFRLRVSGTGLRP
jgi:hypothetical protein